MPNSEVLSRDGHTGAEVFTLPEVAAYLRVPEDSIAELISNTGLPAQKIGGEWRFLKRAVMEWLRYGPHFCHDFKAFPPPWVLDHPLWEDLIRALEKRILGKVAESECGQPGSKQAVLSHFGVFRDDDDLDRQLADLHALRKAHQQ